ncbi:leptin receptor gene-related protein isoform X1 [Galendromus occidentalis]|uniref:Leptin receptor gene-related protein isoform X1 n=1 Tax=Galendromus occidentalis TaxID=34638 RepID=A0AAJ7L2B6_9ACAR|nr:leptin receptor gene-related protein isoform X1 [Galendromus occidentalis]
MTMLILACALPSYGTWYPFINVVFYMLALPLILIVRNSRDAMSSVSTRQEVSLFLTAVLLVSAFALPVILARVPEDPKLIQWSACGLTLLANVVVFGTIIGFFVSFSGSDSDYSTW